MDLAEMQAKFVTRVGGLTAEWSDASINTFLDAAYRYGIAAEVPGSLTDGEWTITTVDGTAEYDYDDSVYEAKGIARLEPNEIGTYYRKSAFEAEFPSTTNDAKPWAVLLYGRVAKFHPAPDAIYTVTIPVRLYPALGVSDDTLNGLANHNHAMAVVCEAVREWAEDYDEDAIMARESQALLRYLSRIKTQSLARVRERAGRLSF